MPAVQQQVRSHTRHSRGRHRSAAGAELPEVGGSVSCTDCGDIVPRSALLYAGHGAVCAVCHGQAEDRGAAEGSAVREVARGVVRAVGLAL
jgi:hypothetical protein